MAAVFPVGIDSNGRELTPQGTPLFPCAFYERNVRDHITGDIPPHWHKEAELFYLERGFACLTLIDRKEELRPGEGYFVNSGVLHGVVAKTEDPCLYRSVVFDPALVSGAPGSVFDLLYVRPFVEHGLSACVLQEDSPAFPYLHAAFSANEGKADGYEFSVRQELSKLFLFLRGRAPETAVRPAAQQELRMKQMLAWLDAHYGEPLAISQLAATAGISIRECQRSFAGFLHHSPMQYLTRRRITAAAEYLTSTDLPVTEIGLRCGFESPSYFAKQFKAVTGKTPREYRNGRTHQP